MGLDTKYWGPSGWQLLHMITFTKGNTEAKRKLFTAMPKVLPCKFCRESAIKFLRELPLESNLAFWLYKFHDKVNKKLEKQHLEDSNIEKPVPSPPFEDVVKHYKTLLEKPYDEIPGRDFLFSVAYNYDGTDKEAHTEFWSALKKVYPNSEYRQHIRMPNFETYLKDVHDMMSEMSDVPSLKGVTQRLSYYKSGCSTKTYKGKTCRKLPSGGYTKNRDRKRTYRISHSALVH